LNRKHAIVELASHAPRSTRCKEGGVGRSDFVAGALLDEPAGSPGFITHFHEFSGSSR